MRYGVNAMNIEQLDQERILISLCDKEMEQYSVTFDQLDLYEKNSETMLRELLLNASEQTGISMKDKHILIEAMKFEHGCLLLITVSASKKRKSYKVRRNTVFRTLIFDNADNLFGCIGAFSRIKVDTVSSSLLAYKNRYYLILSSSESINDNIISTAYEFDADIRYGKNFTEFLYEHGSLLSAKNAVDEISSAMNYNS